MYQVYNHFCEQMCFSQRMIIFSPAVFGGSQLRLRGIRVGPANGGQDATNLHEFTNSTESRELVHTSELLTTLKSSLIFGCVAMSDELRFSAKFHISHAITSKNIFIQAGSSL